MVNLKLYLSTIQCIYLIFLQSSFVKSLRSFVCLSLPPSFLDPFLRTVYSSFPSFFQFSFHFVHRPWVLFTTLFSYFFISVCHVFFLNLFFVFIHIKRVSIDV